MGYPWQIYMVGHGSCRASNKLTEHCSSLQYNLSDLWENFQVPLNFKSIKSLAKSYTWTYITSSMCVVKLKGTHSFWPNTASYAAENLNCILCPLLMTAGAPLRQQEHAHSHHNTFGAAALYRKRAQHSHTAVLIPPQSTVIHPAEWGSGEQ